MNLSFFIARRYFLSGKKKNFINVISIISMVVLAIGTMSLVVALSVFNGLEGLLRSMYGNFDPDIVVFPASGKSFIADTATIQQIKQLDEVAGVAEVIEDNVLVEYKDAQRLVRMKGVSEDFEKYSGIRNVMVGGTFSLIKDSIGYALIGRGVQYDLSLSLQNDFYTLQLYYPRDIQPGVVNPSRMYNLLNIMPGGVFAIEKYYDDNYLFVPLPFARELLNYKGKLNALDIYLKEDINAHSAKEKIQEILGHSFEVKMGEELHSDLYKVLKVEKLFVFIILVSIIGIASINIFFALTMLVIEKKKDISILFAQGASEKLIRNIFLCEGFVIALSGSLIGLVLGLLLSFLQQRYGLVTMGMESAVFNAYPVKVAFLDLLYTVITIILITLLASIQPAIKASKTFTAHLLQ